MKTHQDLYEFMHRYTLGVISTVDEDKAPHSAIVGFGQTKDLEILIGRTTGKRTLMPKCITRILMSGISSLRRLGFVIQIYAQSLGI
jgi:hypothetical protein